MKWRSVLSALLLLLTLCTPTWAQTDTLPDGLGNEVRTPEGLKAIIDRRDPRFVIVDVRSPAEYAAGHIPTAINVPGGVTADVKAPPPKDKYIVVYCHGGLKAPLACEKMLADGYKYVFVWGGIVKWPYEKETLSRWGPIAPASPVRSRQARPGRDLTPLSLTTAAAAQPQRTHPTTAPYTTPRIFIR